MAPTTMKQWIVRDKENGFDSLHFSEGPVPKVTENDVLVKFHAAALNYRDLIIPKVSVGLLFSREKERREESISTAGTMSAN